MKAVLLLLIALKLVFAQNPVYNWTRDNPHSAPWGSSEPQNECETDPGTCQCCLMMKKVEEVRSALFRKLDDLETELNQTQRTYMELITKRSAFTAALFDTKNNLNCLGNYDDTITIMYKKVFTNLGANYNPLTGIYTAPFNGVYSFTVSVFHDAGQGSNEKSCANLVMNEVIMAGSQDIHTFDHEDSTTMSITLSLKAGDQMKVQLPPRCLLCMIKDHYNVFSGFLLYAD